MDDPRRILLIRPSALGDVCRTVPLLVSLRRAYPAARIDWLVQDGFGDAIRHHPDLSGVVPFARAELGRSMKRANPIPTLRFLHELRSGAYDLAIDAQGLFRSGLFARATRAGRRIGPRDAREGAARFYSDRVTSGHPHTVDRMLALLNPLGIEAAGDMRLYTSDEDRAWAEDVCDGRSPIIIASTSRWLAKRWPAERFATIARELAGEHLVVIVGGPAEHTQIQPVLALARTSESVLDLVGKTTVARLMALIERAKLVIANDSAAVHMGVAFGRPLVALYGPTNVARVGPYGRAADVIQHLEDGDRLEHKDDARITMMERIAVEEVLERAVSRLANTSTSPKRERGESHR